MEEDGVVEIDLAELFRKNIVLLIVATIVVGAIAFGASYLIPNEYTASTSMYVLIHGQKDTKTDAKTSLSSTDLRTAQMVASDVTVILKSNRVANDVAQRLGIGSLSEECRYALVFITAHTLRVFDAGRVEGRS